MGNARLGGRGLAGLGGLGGRGIRGRTALGFFGRGGLGGRCRLSTGIWVGQSGSPHARICSKNRRTVSRLYSTVLAETVRSPSAAERANSAASQPATYSEVMLAVDRHEESVPVT